MASKRERDMEGLPAGSRESVANEGGRPIAAATPDPEVPDKPARRTFSAKYKAQILAEADRCTKPGELGTLLRREGLYSSLLVTWRRQREEGTIKALAPRKRGRKKKAVNPLAKRVAELERSERRLKRQLAQAEVLLEIQKKASDLLGIQLKGPESLDYDE